MTATTQRSGAPPPSQRPAPESRQGHQHSAQDTRQGSASGSLSPSSKTSIPPDTTPSEAELLAEARRLAYVAAGVPPVRLSARWVEGRAVVTRDRPEPPLPVVGSPQWWDAPEPIRAAALLFLGTAYLVADPDLQVRERLRAVSWDLAEAMRGRRGGPSHAELDRRRAEPGRLAREIDPAAVAHWVTTGRSDGEVPAA